MNQFVCLVAGHMEEFRKINKNIYKPPVSEEIKEIVRRNFTREIEFYQFCRQKLHKQFLALKLSQPKNSNYHWPIEQQPNF